MSYVQDNDLYVAGIDDGAGTTPDDRRRRDRLQRRAGLGVQRGTGHPRSPAGLRLVARRQLADLPAPGRERRPQRPGHRLPAGAGDGQLHPLSDRRNGEPGGLAPCADPGSARAAAGALAARRHRVCASVLHLDARLQPRALYHGEPRSHQAGLKHVDPAKRRDADPHHRRQIRTGSTKNAMRPPSSLATAASRLPLAVGARRLHASLSVRPRGDAGPAGDRRATG